MPLAQQPTQGFRNTRNVISPATHHWWYPYLTFPYLTGLLALRVRTQQAGRGSCPAGWNPAPESCSARTAHCRSPGAQHAPEPASWWLEWRSVRQRLCAFKTKKSRRPKGNRVGLIQSAGGGKQGHGSKVAFRVPLRLPHGGEPRVTGSFSAVRVSLVYEAWVTPGTAPLQTRVLDWLSFMQRLT